MAEPFVIDQVAWHTNTPGNTETREKIARRFCVLANFLQANGLTTRDLTCREEDIDDEYEISTEDLTEEGFAFMQAGYDKWLRKIDNGMPPDNVSVLTRALNRVRSK